MTQEKDIPVVSGPDFQITTEEDGEYVFATVTDDLGTLSLNLGKRAEAIEAMCQFLASMDQDELEMRDGRKLVVPTGEIEGRKAF